MNLFSIYEGSVFKFEEAKTAAQNENWSKSIELLSEAFEDIENTVIVKNTNVRRHVEVTYKKLQSEKVGESEEHFDKVINTIDNHQSKMIKSPK